MNDGKKLKREIKKTWDALKQERRERSKMLGAVELTESAQRIAGHADDLKKLAKRMEDAETAALAPAPIGPKKTKPKLKSGAKARAAKAERQADAPSDIT